MRPLRRTIQWASGALTLGLAGVAAAAPPVGAMVSFVACPIAQDTGPDTDLCFFTEHDGVRYGLSNPPDFGSPQLRHQVLVEGRVTGGPSVCGGLALEGTVSVLRELDLSCEEVRPYDGSVKGIAGGVFNSGSPQQRAAAQDLARRAQSDPSLTILPAMPDPPPAPTPEPPFTHRTLEVIYPFDSDRGSGPDMIKLLNLAHYAGASRAKVTVTGYGGPARLTDGTVLKERQGMAQDRAEKIAGILTGLGVPSAQIAARWDEHARPDAAGAPWTVRRVVVEVAP